MSDSSPDAWRLNVAAIILDEADNVLVGSTSGKSAYWHFPQGGVDKDESFAEAVLREVQEEVGLRADDCTILASYGGLRYRYRHKNKKSERWLGQQQTYYLIRCRGIQPTFENAPISDELERLRWVPWRQLTAEMFVPFKREVVMKALRAFFGDAALTSEAVAQRLSTRRYAGSASHLSTDDKFLFGGGKEEMEAQLADVGLCINREQRRLHRDKLVVCISGLPGSGLTNCVRRLAKLMDPLFTYAVQPPHLEPKKLLAEMPAGTCRLLVETSMHGVSDFYTHLQAECQAQQVTLLHVFLHVSHAEHCKRADEPMPADIWQMYVQRMLQQCGEQQSGNVAYAIPSDSRWYRDYVLASLVLEQLAQMQ